MRKLVLTVYGVILVVLIGSMWLVETLGEDIYVEEITYDYQEYTHLLSSLIIESMKAPNAQLGEVLNRLDEYYDSVEIVPTKAVDIGELKIVGLVGRPKITVVSVEDQTDQVQADVVLGLSDGGEVSLKFLYIDSYSDEYIAFHQLGSMMVLLLLGVVISVLMYFLYRYLMSISRVTQSVAVGDFDSTMPNSRFNALQTISNDINKMSNQLEARAQENIIFMGALHHEIRIPITRLRLAMDMALQTKDRESLESMIQDMDGDLDDLIGLSEEMLSIAKLSLESSEMPKEPIHLDQLVKDIVESFADNRITVSIPKEPVAMTANKLALERALVNVIGNALKYGKQKIAIDVVSDKGQVAVIVEDDGEGISEAELQHVLKPFYRVDKGRARSTGGFGLGLSITNSLVNKLGGQLRLGRSDLGGVKVELALGG